MKNDLLLVGDIARATGVSVDTIRHYERKSVIPEAVRDASGYRRYPEESIVRIRIVRRAQSIGFTLDELARIFRQRASGHPPCRNVRALAARKLAEIDERMAALVAVRTQLVDTLAAWDSQLASTSEGNFAHLLDSLIE